MVAVDKEAGAAPEGPMGESLDARPQTEASLHRTPRLSQVAKSIYGSGDLVEDTVTAAINIFLFRYTTAVCGVSGSLAGLVAALLIDSIAYYRIDRAEHGYIRATLNGRRTQIRMSSVPRRTTSMLESTRPALGV
jgi:GPH family glycoside/pentoside/hexuronide:cation symporter